MALPLPALHELPETSSIFFIALEDTTSASVRAGVNYWNALRGARAMPSRDELAMREMARFLRDVVLVRVIDNGADYEYRVAGDAHVEAFGFDFKGVRLSMIEAADPDAPRHTRATYEYVRNTGEPYAVRGWVGRDVPDPRFVYHESAFLPLGSNGAIDHLLIVSHYVKRLAA